MPVTPLEKPPAIEKHPSDEDHPAMPRRLTLSTAIPIRAATASIMHAPMPNQKLLRSPVRR